MPEPGEGVDGHPPGLDALEVGPAAQEGDVHFPAIRDELAGEIGELALGSSSAQGRHAVQEPHARASVRGPVL